MPVLNSWSADAVEEMQLQSQQNDLMRMIIRTLFTSPVFVYIPGRLYAGVDV